VRRRGVEVDGGSSLQRYIWERRGDKEPENKRLMRSYEERDP
jgi:hypothetical protein